MGWLLKCRLLLFSRQVVSDSLHPPWIVACQAPLSMGFSRQRILEWIAISFSRGLLHWQVDSLLLSHQENPTIHVKFSSVQLLSPV